MEQWGDGVTALLLQFDFISAVWIEWLPRTILAHLTPIALIILGYFMETYYVSRPAVFANALAVNVYVRDVASPDQLLIIYANLGLVMAAIGMYTYAAEESLSKSYYGLAQLYGSPVAALAILIF
jgi:ribosomal protein L16 Arg81 hydroxylase